MGYAPPDEARRTSMQHILALDLKGDPALITQYEEHHRSVWPQVVEHLKAQGVTGMTIHRLGTRMVMVMTTDDAVFDEERFSRESARHPVVQRWEELMWRFQTPTPWTPPGKKWTPMSKIFDLAS
jgi:L-rhamnose mutarotase